MSWMNQSTPSTAERIVAGICYLTFGLVGLLYIVISGRSGQTQFFRFHFLQSIIIGILGLLLSWASAILVSILTAMLSMLGPTIAAQTSGIVILAVNILGKAGFVLLLYGMIWAFLGKYAHIPFISNIVYQQMR